MSECLRDRTLVRLTYGEGTARQRHHLAACSHCADRMTAIARAREVATIVLKAATVQPVSSAFVTSNAASVRGRRGIRLVAPVAAGAAIAAAIVLLLRPPMMSGAGRAAAVVSELSLDDIAESAFTFDESEWLRTDADDLRWEAALRGERVCESDDGFSDSDCS
jgi:hypothetical protein